MSRLGLPTSAAASRKHSAVSEVGSGGFLEDVWRVSVVIVFVVAVAGAVAGFSVFSSTCGWVFVRRLV